MSGNRCTSGFSLAELLVAVALMLVISSSLLALAHAAVAPGSATASAVDVQERARAAVGDIRDALHDAGAGLDAGLARGGLASFVPAVIPRRLGATNADPPDAARSDAFTVLGVPTLVGQTSSSLLLSSPMLTVSPGPLCLPSRDLCGLPSSLIVFDATGFDLYDVVNASGPVAALRLRGATSAGPFAAGAFVAPLEARAFYVDPALRQLRMSDTDQTDVAIVDEVESMAVEYWGTSSPITEPRPPVGVANCLYDSTGALLPQTAPAGPLEEGLVALPLEALGDGPWCGHGSTRIDADLLRIRRIRVTIRLEAADPEARATDAFFLNPGVSHSALRRVPDLELTFVVAPPNLQRAP